jgi:hypothetical protein
MPDESTAAAGHHNPREFKTAAVCGSMRFYDRMIKVAERLTSEGVVVLMPFVTVQAADQGDEFKHMLDRMHKQKIDMSDHIVVVTDADKPYVGDSTNSEIQYAAKHGKAITWALERAEHGDQAECPSCHTPHGRPHTDYCQAVAPAEYPGQPDHCTYPIADHGDGRGCGHDNCPRHGSR